VIQQYRDLLTLDLDPGEVEDDGIPESPAVINAPV
jgi:hypothetical protein